MFPKLMTNLHIVNKSCDTEDWSNDADNSALISEINYILQYIKIKHVF